MKIIPPEQLIEAYSNGIFPMSDYREDDSFQWYSATRRGIIPIEKFHISKNVRRLIRQNNYQISYNRDFHGVMESCADRDSTWISDIIINSFTYLHKLGYAHSVEVWDEDQLVGGLYGVAIGGAFFGESMFKKVPEADKIALYFCHQRLVKNNFTLWDTQFYTEHLAQFGGTEIPSKEYEKRLAEALAKSVYFDKEPPDTILLNQNF